MAVVGIHGHGFASHIRNYPFLPDVEVAALCDVDENMFPERLKWFEDNNIGNIFYGSEGYMTIFGGRWQTFLGQKREPGPSGQEKGSTDRTHYQNFIDAIRANDPSLLRGNVEEGHYSCALIHLANASYRLGRTLTFDPQRQECVKDNEANRMLTREYRTPFVVPKQV